MNDEGPVDKFTLSYRQFPDLCECQNGGCLTTYTPEISYEFEFTENTLQYQIDFITAENSGSTDLSACFEVIDNDFNSNFRADNPIEIELRHTLGNCITGWNEWTDN